MLIQFCINWSCLINSPFSLLYLQIEGTMRLRFEFGDRDRISFLFPRPVWSIYALHLTDYFPSGLTKRFLLCIYQII